MTLYVHTWFVTDLTPLVITSKDNKWKTRARQRCPDVQAEGPCDGFRGTMSGNCQHDSHTAGSSKDTKGCIHTTIPSHLMSPSSCTFARNQGSTGSGTCQVCRLLVVTVEGVTSTSSQGSGTLRIICLSYVVQHVLSVGKEDHLLLGFSMARL